MHAHQQGPFEKRLASGLASLLKHWGSPIDIRPHEVLLDVPHRDPAHGGFVYIREGDTLVNLASRSKPVAHIRENYEGLARRARIFMSPRLAYAVGDRRLLRRDEIRAVVSECVESPRRSQVG